MAILVKPDDIMKKVRIKKNASLIVFLVDLSWSMAVTQRLTATKNAINMILIKAYQYRDDICLLAFQKDHASILISPTHSVALAEKAMKNVPIGGKTPLSAGLKLAHEVLEKESKIYGKDNIFLVVLSDCDGNVSFSEKEPQEEAVIEAEKIAAGRYRSIIINSDQMTFGQGHANNLAKHMNAACYLISGFSSDHLMNTLRNELIL